MLARDEDAKGQWRHTEVTLAPMWFPSSKTCSARGTVNPGMEADAPQAWKRGSPEADHAPRHGAGMGEAERP